MDEQNEPNEIKKGKEIRNENLNQVDDEHICNREIFLRKLIKKKRWILLIVLLVFAIIGLAVGLSIHFPAESQHPLSTTTTATTTTTTITTTKTTTMTTNTNTITETTSSTTTSKTTVTTAMIKVTQEPPQKAVLMLSTLASTNVPVVIGLNGKSNLNACFEILAHLLSSGDFDDDIKFNYDENTEVFASCSASLNDRMLVFGGWNQRHQVYT